jgi:hypothetical protein
LFADRDLLNQLFAAIGLVHLGDERARALLTATLASGRKPHLHNRIRAALAALDARANSTDASGE